MSIGSGVLLPGVVEIPPFRILRPLAYTTGLGYRPTCDSIPVHYFLFARKLFTLNTLTCWYWCKWCELVKFFVPITFYMILDAVMNHSPAYLQQHKYSNLGMERWSQTPQPQGTELWYSSGDDRTSSCGLCCVICFREGILFALGNPLLDISAEVTEKFLKRWLL